MLYGLCGSRLTGARFTMSATLLHQNEDWAPLPDLEGEDINLDNYGEWVKSQDPLTKEIISVWVPFEDIPETPDVDESVKFGTIKCLARGIVDGGIRVAGSTERFGDTYENVDYVKLWVPPSVRISKRDRVTNIRDPRGTIQWKDEEFADPVTGEGARATVFNVNGVTPLFDALNNIVEQYVFLERASVVQEDERV